MPRTKTRPEVTPPDLDGARDVVRPLAQARSDEKRARIAREDYIEAEKKRGVRAHDIAAALQAAAGELNLDALGLTVADREKLGNSEASVHQALNRRGAKG